MYGRPAGRPHDGDTARSRTTRRPDRPDDPGRPAGRPYYADIGLAMLRRGLAAPGRLWLLLRHLDGDGRGWVTVAEARARLTGKGAPLRICGWRQLRNLLRQGQGIFWERDGERIWYRSTLRVADALGVERLTGRPVDLPLVRPDGHHRRGPLAPLRQLPQRPRPGGRPRRAGRSPSPVARWRG